ncbi:MAG: HlyD family type I secretion periplasmic adaptor subunit [Pseudomonadota bacterium]
MFARSSRPRTGVFRKADLRSRNHPPFVAGMVVGTLTIFVGFAIVIAGWTSVPEVTRAPGEIAPTNDFVQIEAHELGTVVAVAAREGDVVTEGQVLATLNSIELSQQELTIKEEIRALREQERNSAFVLDQLANETDQVPKPVSENGDLTYALSTLRTFQARQDSDLNTLDQLARDAERHLAAMARLQTQVDAKTTQVADTTSLFEKGLATRAQLTASKDALSAVVDQLHNFELSLSATEKEISTLRAKLTNDRLTLKELHVERHFEVSQQLALKHAQRRTLAERIAGLEIIAPTDGRIHSVGFPNQGEVIDRGEQLFELLPTGDSLIAVLRLPTREIGHISTGMSVQLRLETFDTRSTEPLVGEIVSISPNRVYDRDLGEDYFRATVELNEDDPSFSALSNRIRAGMALTAEVVTRERSMLAYLLKPVERSISSAFSER